MAKVPQRGIVESFTPAVPVRMRAGESDARNEERFRAKVMQELSALRSDVAALRALEERIEVLEAMLNP